MVAAAGVLARSPWLLWVGFVLVHVWLISEAHRHSSQIYGDVGLYAWWAEQGWNQGIWPVLDIDWVYPVGALLPIAGAGVGPLAYATTWVLGILLLNALATWLLIRTGERGTFGAWWWLAFLLLLGPISLGRLDGVAAPIILVAAVLGLRHPTAAAAVATAGAWIKIAPAAVFLALFAVARGARLRVLAAGAAVSAVVVGLALLAGSGMRVFSVFGEQGKRGLQAESVLATPFSLERLFSEGANPVYNDIIYTYEFLQPAAATLAGLADLLLFAAVAAIVGIAWWTAQRRPDERTTVLLLAAQAVLVALVVFNKVGSPQFVAWLGPVVAVALTGAAAARRRWELPAFLLLVVAALTQAIYPIAYGGFINGEAGMVLVAALRNLLVLAVLVIAVVDLVSVARGGADPAPSEADGAEAGGAEPDGATSAAPEPDGATSADAAAQPTDPGLDVVGGAGERG